MSETDYKEKKTKNLKKYMELNNKTQADIINDLGLSSSTVSNWCTGQKLPRMNKIEMLANYFGINKSDLIESKVTTETKTKDGDIERIERAREKMDDDDKEAMMKVLEAAFAKYFND